ncbi:Fungal Zn(2)-Cys(6) binuclear cluster domain-containing protein [Penicillium ucsense]|uniref:Fungal Zn(2)-Cys(6) binuclear cluster domain-containing protein n=1 Tax=Penicillium ucsense TaxID=2839758 RepID=A0A8J8W6C9_9EURO|nr:Fungal Zn(2)-Cys(6) binuclear cluster domain-containing protein [Penicillium ucsense]KAF7734753.1 Fungal Zn(2)-Cys(6) binuclear cluster domain-containing protein [Penicillium ucsense]
MRSSIACARCRRSKIKCVNSGIDTTCRACESSGRDCVYPTPAIGVTGKRDLASLAEGDDRNGDWDGPKRSRPRKSIGMAPSPGARAGMDALDASLLTPKVWEAVFDLFQSHFVTLLPFLHPATFLSQTRLLSSPLAAPIPSFDTQETMQNLSLKTDPSTSLIPLGVLALTARFHPPLVAFHSPSAPGTPSNPLAASEYYATALRSRLAGLEGANMASADLTRVQALLMLALHEWGMCRGKSAWVYVGMAIRLAQAMGLPFELENEFPLPDVSRSSPGFKTEADHFGLSRRLELKEPTSDDIIALETKRRTFWACFLLDRCLSSGKYRPRMIRVKELDIQLPSDNAFAFGERVRTSRLTDVGSRRPPSFGSQGMQIPSIRQSIGGFGEEKLQAANGVADSKAWSPVSRRKDSTEEDVDRWEIGAEESVLSRVIRVIRIWGSIAKWSCAGGRRTEQYPPWHPESQFAALRMRLTGFRDSLSRNLQYSLRNTDTHLMYKTTLASYTVMHVVYFLSVIVLHRAYIPFLPIRCNEPVGPLDEPLLPSDKVNGPPEGFWRDSARELFKAARQIIDLVVTCQARGALVENPLVGFAIYNAAFIGVYASHFPHMDPESLMGVRSPPASHDSHQLGAAQARKALDILREMRPRLKMAHGWFRTLNRLHSYFSKVKRDFRRYSRNRLDSISDMSDHAASNGARPLREGGLGGGLEEFKLLEKLFLDFGTIEDQLPDSLEDDTGTAIAINGEPMPDRMMNLSDAGSNAVKSDLDGSEIYDGAGGRRESWVPINSPGLPPPPGREMDRRPSLPLPSTRPMPSQSPYSLPSLQPHHPEAGAMYTSSPPSLPSIATTTQSPSQYLTATSNRLQPINSWLPSRPSVPPPPYSSSLPPINAPAPNGLSVLPLPGTVTQLAPSPPLTSTDGPDTSLLLSTSLGGDDVLAFLDGCDTSHLSQTGPSEIGIPTGWLSTVWAQLTR